MGTVPEGTVMGLSADLADDGVPEGHDETVTPGEPPKQQDEVLTSEAASPHSRTSPHLNHNDFMWFFY